MTREQFILQQQKRNEFSIKRTVVVLGSILVFCSVPIGVAYVVSKDTTPERSRRLLGIGLIVYIIAVYFGLLVSVRRNLNTYSILCPGCGKRILGFTGQIAIATGNCGYCGVKVFDESETST